MLGLDRRRSSSGRPAARRPSSGPAGAGRAVIPFDHVARFALTGQPGSVVSDVVNIGPEGVFVATTIGYGLEAERGERLPLLSPPELVGAERPRPAPLADVTLGRIPPPALMDGFQLAPGSEPFALADGGAGGRAELASTPLPPEQLDRALRRVRPAPDDFQFLLSMVDTATGRELQDEPMHSLASLGSPRGERPFRPLAQPMRFLPRSTLRLQIVERTEGVRGTLFVALHGYLVLTGSACSEGMARALAAVRPGAAPAGARVVPFDYVASLPLSGRPGVPLESEVAVNADGGFVATSIGYGLAPAEGRAVALLWERADEGTRAAPEVDLSTLPLRLFPVDALRDGVRLRPEYVRLAWGGRGLGRLRRETVDEIFERLNRPEDVSFRYAISDTGSGHDWQSQPVHNLAGLGTASGRRPFKRLAYPMSFAPRSTILVSVEEGSGRGVLQVVFQGYKLLEGASGGRP